MSVLNSPQLGSILERILPHLGPEADIHPLVDIEQLNKIKKHILSQKSSQDYLIKHYNEIPHQQEDPELDVNCSCKQREVVQLKLSEVLLSTNSSITNVRRHLQQQIFAALQGFDFNSNEILKQLGPLQVIGGIYLFQDKTNEELIAVQILYFRTDVKSYSFPLMHFQAKFAVHFDLKNDTQPILLDKLTPKKVQFLGQRKINILNPFQIKKNASILEGLPPYMLLFGTPSHKIATMTFKILPTEHWMIFYSKVNSKRQILSSSDNLQAMFIGQQQEMTVKLTLTKMEANSTEEVENVATLPFPFNCDIGCVGAKNDTGKEMYLGVTYEWDYRQRYLCHSTAFINLVNVLFQFQGLDSAEPFHEKELTEHINNLLQQSVSFQSEIQAKDDKEPVPIEILSDEERKFWIRDDNIKYTFNSPEFKEWMQKGKLFIEEGENGIEFGCRVLAYINKNITYSALDEFRGCGEKGVASGVVLGQTDCGGKALLFCSVMRANKIPARLLHGQFAEVGNTSGSHLANITKEELAMGYHVMAEFYVNGLGWVPIETTGPVRMVGVDYQGFLYARDRSKAFLVKHYDYVYEIDYSKFLPKKKTSNSKSQKFLSWLKKLATNSKHIVNPYYLSGFFGVRVEHHLTGLNLSSSSQENDNNIKPVASIQQQNACTTGLDVSSLTLYEQAKEDTTEMNFQDFLNTTQPPPQIRDDYNLYNYNGIDVTVPRLNWFQDVASVDSILKYSSNVQ